MADLCDLRSRRPCARRSSRVLASFGRVVGTGWIFVAAGAAGVRAFAVLASAATEAAMAHCILTEPFLFFLKLSNLYPKIRIWHGTK